MIYLYTQTNDLSCSFLRLSVKVSLGSRPSPTSISSLGLELFNQPLTLHAVVTAHDHCLQPLSVGLSVCSAATMDACAEKAIGLVNAPHAPSALSELFA